MTAEPEQDDTHSLERSAREASGMAYSPYSDIRVGAALEAEDGRVFTGCNVENASYGLTLCAERTALFKAVSEGVKSFRRIAVCSSLPKTLMPCGACRQVLAEFAPDLEVIVLGDGDERQVYGLGELLPGALRRGDLA